MRRAESGYTLVELLVTLAVLAIVASISVVAYRDYVETARLGTLKDRINGVVVFEQNYYIENSTYLPGTYEPGANGLSDMGYRVEGDDDDISLEVAACDGGAINRCFRVTATNSHGQRMVWDDGEFLEQGSP